VKQVRAKKHLGQHFLRDKECCARIANEVQMHHGCTNLLEIGPGMGALTDFLLKKQGVYLKVMEIDRESIPYLEEHFPRLSGNIMEQDFLKSNASLIFDREPFVVAGNFPYNISSQILFKCLENREFIPEITGMFQKEVAERIAEPPGSKQYGILSVLMQAFYTIDYCFTVDEHVFDPPPKVKSGVIRCVRNERQKLPCNEQLFKQIVKMGFNQRRKTLRNSLKSLLSEVDTTHIFFTKRPEQLSVEDFIVLTNWISKD